MLAAQRMRDALRGEGYALQIGPFSVNVKSTLPEIAAGLTCFYQGYPSPQNEFADFHIAIEPSSVLRRWYHPQVNVDIDSIKRVKEIPASLAFTGFEWGLNYCTTVLHKHLIIDAAVVEKDGCAVILPGRPGSEKTALAAALASGGWRLISADQALIPVADPDVVTPLARPILLEGASIDLVKAFAPEETFGPVVSDSERGSITHMRAPPDSIRRIDEPGSQKFIVFPHYHPRGKTRHAPRTKAHAFIETAQLSSNFNVLAETGFNMLNRIITRCDCYDFAYANLDDALSFFNGLLATDKPSSEPSPEPSPNTVTSLGGTAS